MDNIVANPGVGGETLATDDIGGVQFPRTKLVIGADGVNGGDVHSGNPLPVAVQGGVTISGSVEVVNDVGNPLPVSGPLTDLQLRAAAVAVASTAARDEDTAHASGHTGIFILAVRRDVDSTPVDADGDYAPLLVDEVGRLKVAAQPGSQAAITGSITASGQSVSGDVSRTSNVTAYVTGTFAGHNCTFEGSIDGGVSWFAIQAVRTNANTIELTTGVLGAAPAYAWELSVNGLTNIRVRSTAHTSGTANWRIQPAPYATEPIPAAQVSGTQPVSGTVTANIGTGALAAGANAIGDVGLQVRANATGAASQTNVVAAASTNATSVKASAGRVLGWTFVNNATAVRYVKLHNTAAAPTPGTGVVATIPVPPNGGVASLSIPQGMGFATGIGLSIVTGAAASDATAVAANDVVGTLIWA